MKTAVGIGITVLLMAAAFGTMQFFGIVSANEIIHPRSTARRLEAHAAMPAKLPAEAGCTERLPLVLVWSIRNEPRRWSIDRYEFTGPRVTLWIGNDIDFLGVQPNLGFPYSAACRALVWNTIEDWKRASADALAE